MRPQVIAGIFDLGGIVIGVFINGLFEYFKTRRERVKKEVALLCGQMISFCHLEKNYIEEIIKLRAGKGIEAKEKGVMDEFHHFVYDDEEGRERITHNISKLNTLKEQYK